MAGRYQGRGGYRGRSQQQQPPPGDKPVDKPADGGAQNAVVDTRRAQPVATLRDLMQKMRGELERALVGQIDVDRFLRMALTVVQKSPNLQNCTARSILGSMMECAQLRLVPDGVLGHAYLVPFKTVCTVIVGYRGFIELLMRSGRLKYIQPFTVRERDKWSYSPTRTPSVIHEPARPLPKPPAGEPEIANEIVAFYTKAELLDGTIVYQWMWKTEVDEHRERSRAKDDGPWQTDYEAMGWKTVIRQYSKYAGLSAESQAAAVADEQRDFGLADVIDIGDDSELAAAASEHRADQLAEKYKKPDDTAGAGDGTKPAGDETKPPADGTNAVGGETKDQPAATSAEGQSGLPLGDRRDPGQEG